MPLQRQHQSWGRTPPPPLHRSAAEPKLPQQVLEKSASPLSPCAWHAWLRFCSPHLALPADPSHAAWSRNSMRSWTTRRRQLHNACRPSPCPVFHCDPSFADCSCRPPCPTSWDPSHPLRLCRRRLPSPGTPSTVAPAHRELHPSQNLAIAPWRPESLRVHDVFESDRKPAARDCTAKFYHTAGPVTNRRP